MKLPAASDRVTIDRDPPAVPYPPLGFHQVSEFQLGNGDVFGLYWPIGREDFDPLVAETHHDEWSLEPHFSSLDRFLAAAGDDDDEHVEAPGLQDDPFSPTATLWQARDEIKANQVESAIRLLESVVAQIPEYTEAQSLLFSQYRRTNQRDNAIRAAIQAIISPPCFGIAPPQLVGWLASQGLCPADLESDPIWKSRSRLNSKFGGVKENDIYLIYQDVIEEYLGKSEFVPAMTMMQTYAERMYVETVSFQERYGFVVKEYVARQRHVAKSLYGKARELDVT